MITITLDKVSKRYAGAPTLDNVSLTAPAGKVLALLGPSGSGKSTALRLIAGLEALDSGEIRFDDAIVSSQTHQLAPEQRRVGMVFQDYALFPHLSAAANVAFGLAALPRAARHAEALRWLEQVGLATRAHAFPHELSGGEQQRVALARALAPRPRAVLLDEPFSGLDPVLRAELREVTLAALKQSGATALFVTHDAEEALLVADRLAILKQGRLLQEAPPREAYNHPTCLDAAAALGTVNVFAGRVANRRIETPFGPVVATLPDGSTAIAVVRAEALTLTPGTQARLLDRRPHGAHDLAQIEAGGAHWRALISPRAQTGDRVDVAIEPSGAFVFEA